MDAEAELLGRLAVHFRMVTPEQLAGALAMHQRNPGQNLTRVLFDLGLLDAAQVAQLQRARAQYAERAGGRAKPAPPPPPPGAVAASLRPANAAPPRVPAAPAPNEVETAGTEAELGPSARAARPNKGRQGARLTWLHRVLTHATASHATDVHLHAGYPVMLRVRGVLTSMRKDVLSAEHARSTLLDCLDDSQREALERDGDVELAYEVPHVGRFRASVYKQQGGLCGVFHYIPSEPPTAEALGLPSALCRLCEHRTGLVLISGPSGSGKTSTMAALIALMNRERDDHILCLEDPIEYRHTSHRCLVNQREVGVHARSFRGALQSALREDPDVICIGELRDRATISLALSAAETGHLVIGTLHTQGAVRTINRIVGAYPPAQQGQVRAMLAESLRGVISQRLVPCTDGESLLLAHELLIVNQAAGNLIRENRTYQLASVMQTGRGQGMQSLDDSLMDLVRAGSVSRDVARVYAENPGAFQ